MSVALLVALLAGALCLGMASALLPLSRGGPEEPELFYEDDFPDLGGPVIDLSPLSRAPLERAA